MIGFSMQELSGQLYFNLVTTVYYSARKCLFQIYLKTGISEEPRDARHTLG